MTSLLRLRSPNARWLWRRSGSANARDRSEIATAWGTWLLPSSEARLLRTHVAQVLETALIARLLKPGDTVVDVGANHGWYTLMAAARVGRTGRVVALEQDPRRIEDLRRLVDRNALSSVVVKKLAVIAATSHGDSVAPCPDVLENAGRDADDQVVDFATLAESVGGRVDFVRIAADDGTRPALEGMVQAVAAGLSPPAVMVEIECEHGDARDQTLSDLAVMLLPDFRLFAVDYGLFTIDGVVGV